MFRISILADLASLLASIARIYYFGRCAASTLNDFMIQRMVDAGDEDTVGYM